MSIFSEQTYIDMYTTIIIDISYFKILSQMQKNHKVFSLLSAALTSSQLKLSWICPRFVLWLLLDAFPLQNSLL